MNGWKVELVLTVKGPNEGPVTASIEYEDTTKDMALVLQNKLAELAISLNSQS